MRLNAFQRPPQCPTPTKNGPALKALVVPPLRNPSLLRHLRAWCLALAKDKVQGLGLALRILYDLTQPKGSGDKQSESGCK